MPGSLVLNVLKMGGPQENDTLSMLQRLPDLDRTIFNLHVIDGYSHRHIAKEPDINVKQSELRLQAARIPLKFCFREVYPPL